MWSNDFVELPGQWVYQDFSPPAYTNADLIAEIATVDAIYADIILNTTATFDAGIGFGYPANDYMGTKEILGTFYISPDATADQKLEI